jgi:hypothetical protein
MPGLTPRSIERVRRSVEHTEAQRRRVDAPSGRETAASDQGVYARLTAAGASEGLYQAVEVQWDDSAGEWVDTPSGRTWGGTASDALPELAEVSGRVGLAVDHDKVVHRVYLPPLANDGRWVFSDYVGLNSDDITAKQLRADTWAADPAEWSAEDGEPYADTTVTRVKGQDGEIRFYSASRDGTTNGHINRLFGEIIKLAMQAADPNGSNPGHLTIQSLGNDTYALRLNQPLDEAAIYNVLSSVEVGSSGIDIKVKPLSVDNSGRIRGENPEQVAVTIPLESMTAVTGISWDSTNGRLTYGTTTAKVLDANAGAGGAIDFYDCEGVSGSGS